MSKNKAKLIEELELELTQLRSQLPAHTPKPEMLIKIEELEEEINRLKSE